MREPDPTEPIDGPESPAGAREDLPEGLGLGKLVAGAKEAAKALGVGPDPNVDPEGPKAKKKAAKAAPEAEPRRTPRTKAAQLKAAEEFVGGAITMLGMGAGMAGMSTTMVTAGRVAPTMAEAMVGIAAKYPKVLEYLSTASDLGDYLKLGIGLGSISMAAMVDVGRLPADAPLVGFAGVTADYVEGCEARGIDPWAGPVIQHEPDGEPVAA